MSQTIQTINIGIPIDLQRLLTSRALLQATSGGGKSYLLRKMAESVGDRVQQIIIDPEGEYASLREKFPFVLVGKGGEIPLSLKYAEMIATKILETGISVIIDLYEMQPHERILFVKRFLTAAINAPKNLWHPAIFYVDEADKFAPEGKVSESVNAVINLCAQGRKRGYCAVLATQRIAKLSKDASADLLNKFIGRTSQDLDRKRAAEELGFNKKEDALNLRNLNPGEFFCFGPAVTNEVSKFKVGKCLTSHPESGSMSMAPPPTPDAIKKILSKLSDIPEEAEKELNTKQQLQSEVTRLKSELTKLHNSSKVVKDVKEFDRYQKNIATLEQANLQKQNTIDNYKKVIAEYMSAVKQFMKQQLDIQAIVGKKIEITIPDIKEVPLKFSPIQAAKTEEKRLIPPNNYQPSPQANGSVTGGAMRMLKAAAMYAPKPITRFRIAALARLSYTSGSFGTYVGTLKREGLITVHGNDFYITDEGIKKAGDVEPLPTDPSALIDLWCGIVGKESGAARILRTLGENYPNELSKESIGEEVGMSHSSGSFGTYIGTLKRNGLIKVNGQMIKASDELFN